MKPRHLAPPERLEDRYTMDADPVTVEFLPVAHGAAEKRGEDWNTVRTAGTATQVHHFDVDQAGLQRHLWSGLYYGWEGLAEFDTTLPEGAVVEAATLYVTVTDKVDTMNRRPSLVAHLATQEDAGVITTHEFANAVGDALGSIPFDAVTPGQEIALTLDPSRIPTSGNTLLTLRTSDLIAGQEPNADHNSRSVFYFNGMRLDVRYRIPDAEPEPEPTPEPGPNVEMRIIDIPAVRTIPDNTSIALTPELSVTVGTGWGLHGSSGTGNILRSIGPTNGQPGNPDNPSGGDHLGLSFSTPITRRTVLTLWTDGMSPTDVHALVNDSAARRVDGNADGTIVIDASPENPIASLSVRNYTNGRFGIDHFAIETDVVPEPTPDPLPEDAVFSAPEELRELIAEAVSLSMNSNWRVPEAGEATESSLRKGLHVNLRAAEAPVVGFRATVADAAGVTAHVYRGTQLLSSVAVPTDGAFSYDDEGGFTDVLFARATLATVVATDVSILTEASLETVTDDAIGPMSSKHFALAAAQDLQQPASWSNVHYMFDYGTATSGYSNGEGRVLLDRDPTQYTLIRRLYSSGSGRIADVRTVRQAGYDQYNRPNIEWAGIQPGYVQQLDDNTVLLAPGTPEKIFLLLGSWTAQANIQVTHAATAEQLLPPATMSRQTVQVNRLTMNDQHQTEGIFPALSEVREGSSPVFSHPGHIANIQYHVHNNALTGGALNVKVYVGWYDGEPTRGTLQESFDLSMAGGQTQRISVNLVAPSKPADATSDRPIISAVTTFPDGTTAVNAKLGKEPQSREKRVYTRNSDGTTTMHIESIEYTSREQARIHYLTDRALMALLNSDDNRLAAVRDTLGTDHVIDLIARNTAAALALADQVNTEDAVDEALASTQEFLNADLKVISDGIGGTLDEMSIWDPDALNQYLQTHSYDPAKNNLLQKLSSGEIQNLERTALGKFFLGIAQKAVEANSEAALFDIANVIHNATGIATKKVSIYLKAASSPERRVDMLKQIFAPTNPEHGDPLLRSIFKDQNATNGIVTDTSIALTESHSIRIRFNFATNDQDYHHGNIYLMSSNGEQLSNQPLLQVNITDQFFADIPMINIARAAREIFGLGGLDFLDDTHFRFKVALWDEFNSPAGLQGNNITNAIDIPEVISMNRPEYVAVGSYSTLPNTPEFTRRKSLEDHALSTIKENFPLDRSLTWLNTLGSGFHLGEDSAAIDLNMNTGGDSDEDQPINVVADGTIDSIGLDHGSVRVRHVAHVNGEMRYWFTTYLHMRIVANGTTADGQVLYEARDKNGGVIATLFKGKSLEALDTIGGVCGRGLKNGIRDDHAFKTHLHMEAEDDAGNMIHFGNLLTSMGIHTYAEDYEAVPADMLVDGRRILSWNDTIDEWVNETYNVIFDQELSSSGHDNVWIAWHENPAERKRVIWVQKLPSGQIIDAWLQFDDQSKIWNNHTRQWESI